MELIDLLTKNLGVSSAQAEGGAGMLFKLAKDKLSGDEFGQVTKAVPGVSDLVSKAPSGGGTGGVLGMASKMLGGGSDMGNLAGLASGFSSLDLSPDMISKFLPIILSFVQSKGGDGIKGILEKVLK